MTARLGTDREWEPVLAQGIRELGVDVTSTDRQRLLNFVALLARWNRVYNLTAVRDPMQMITLHLLDSLSILPYLSGSRILDLGTGPGLPGIPLALAAPGRLFTLLDSNTKKTRFLRHAKSELQLENVEVVRSRAEDFRPEPGFDCIIVRAFASLSDILSLAMPLFGSSGGLLLAMKGRRPDAELAALSLDPKQVQVLPLHVPHLDHERHLVRIRTD